MVGAGGSSPASGDSGISGSIASGDVIIADLRQDISAKSYLWLTSGGPYHVRPSTYTHIPGGGYYGQGCGRFQPGYFTGDAGDAAGQHYAGIGEFLGFNEVAPGGACTKLSLGLLRRLGTTAYYRDGIHEGGIGKTVIIQRSGGGDTRPIIIPRGDTTFVEGPCDGTIGNYTEDATEYDLWNSSNIGPDQLQLFEKWQWLQMEIDCATGNGEIRVKVWDEDETHYGNIVLKKEMAEGVGGTMPGTNIVHAFCSSVPTLGSGDWWEIEYAEIWIGVDTGMTPPVGFPGSAR